MKLSKEQKRIVAITVGDVVRDRLYVCWREDNPAKLPRSRKLKKLAKRAGRALKAGISTVSGGR